MIEWRDVVGYEGSYQVSSDGQIRSLDREVLHKHIKIISPGKVLSPRPNKRGYHRAKLSGNEFLVHRLVAIAFIGVIPNGFEVNHKDLNKANNNVSNLEIITQPQNMTHAKENGVFRELYKRRNRNAMGLFTS